MERIIRREIVPESQSVMVYEEMRPLKHLFIWGEPGCEAVLGQLLPEEESLFWKSFDVVIARDEYRNMEKMFTDEGVDVTRIKDVVGANPAEFSLTDLPKSINELKQRLFDKADSIFNKYHLNDLDKAKKDIETILKEDMAYFEDEQRVIVLNTLLSLSNDLPMANIFYARDQSNALGNKIVMSNMRREIRQPEVKVFKKTYDILGYSNQLVNLNTGYFEGGDGYIFGNMCLIGSGYRTDDNGIRQIYNGIGKDLESNGISLYNVANTRKLTKGEEMDAMHLDTFMMPLNKSTVLACGEEVESRKVQLVTNEHGQLKFLDQGSLKDFLLKKEIKVINITKDEQKGYSTNFLHLGNKKVIVPLDDEDHKNVNNLIQVEGGLEIKVAGVKELVGGFGAVHCMTGAIKRG